MNQPPPNWQPTRPPGQPSWPSYPSQTPPPVFSPPPPKPPHIPNWLIYVLIIVFCFPIGYAVGFSAGRNSSDVSVAPPAPTTPQDQPTQTSGTWKTVQTFSGNGNKKTPIFSVSDNWQLSWTCHSFPNGIDGVFNVGVHNADGSTLDFAVNAQCKGSGPTSDSTNEHQGGSIFLAVIAAGGGWSITVQDYQ